MKSENIAKEIRLQIVKGSLKPGERIPGRSELVSDYRASLGTIQRAINTLIDDGFLVSKGTFGTQVSPLPPHLCTYGLAIPQPLSESWDSFWLAMSDSAMKYDPSGKVRFNIYRGLLSDGRGSDYQKLLYDIDSFCISGLVILGAGNIRDGIFIRKPSLPTVLFEENLYDPNISSVSCDIDSLIDKSVAELVRKGRKNIALLSGVQFSQDHIGYFQRRINQEGLNSDPRWIQAIGTDRHSLPWARNIVSLMMQGCGSTRPDGLIIANENHLPYAAEGIASSGLIIGRDVDVVAHANFPIRMPSPSGVSRIGFDCRSLLSACIENITEMRNGRKPGFTRKIQAVCEREIPIDS